MSKKYPYWITTKTDRKCDCCDEIILKHTKVEVFIGVR